jgi:hypothetical protein
MNVMSVSNFKLENNITVSYEGRDDTILAYCLHVETKWIYSNLITRIQNFISYTRMYTAA